MGNRCSCLDQRNEQLGQFMMSRPRVHSYKLQLPPAIFQSHPTICHYAEDIAKNNNLLKDELDFKDRNFTIDQYQHAMILLPHFSHIRRLILSGTQPDMPNIKALGKEISILQSLEQLEISRIYIGSEGASFLGKGMRFLTKLKFLEAESCFLGPQGLKRLIENIYYLEELYVGDNGLGTQGAIIIAELSQNMRNLQVLDIRKNSIGTAGAKILASFLLMTENIKRLELSENELNDGGFQYIIFNISRGIQELGFSSNNITSQGIIASTNKIEKLVQLRILDLSHNPMGDNSAQALEPVLKSLQYLTVLSLADCQITTMRRALRICLPSTDILYNQLLTNMQKPDSLKQLGEIMSQLKYCVDKETQSQPIIKQNLEKDKPPFEQLYAQFSNACNAYVGTLQQNCLVRRQVEVRNVVRSLKTEMSQSKTDKSQVKKGQKRSSSLKRLMTPIRNVKQKQNVNHSFRPKINGKYSLTTRKKSEPCWQQLYKSAQKETSFHCYRPESPAPEPAKLKRSKAQQDQLVKSLNVWNDCKQKKLDELKGSLEVEQLQKCSFTPSINPNFESKDKTVMQFKGVTEYIERQEKSRPQEQNWTYQRQYKTIIKEGSQKEFKRAKSVIHRYLHS